MTILTHTKIMLTAPDGAQVQAKNYSLSLKEDLDSKIKSFDLTCEFVKLTEVSGFTVGTIVDVYHGQANEPLTHIFKGEVTENPRSLSGQKKTFQFNGTCYLGKTQRKLVRKQYVNMMPQEIIRAILTEHAPYLIIDTIQEYSYPMTIKFNNKHVFDCLEQMADLLNATFYVENDHFIFMQKDTGVINQTPIVNNTFEKGSASFTPTTDMLVNYLVVYGGNQLAKNDTTEYITADGENNAFSLKYKPRVALSGKVEVYKNGVAISTGTEFLNDFNEVECLINYGEKVIKFNEAPAAGTKYKVVYRYDYQLVIEVSDIQSIEKYGTYEDTITFDIAELTELQARADQHLKRYADILWTGSLTSLKPYKTYSLGELANVQIPQLKINQLLLITNKTTTFEPNRTKVSLGFEQQTSTEDILKNIMQRLKALEEEQASETIETFKSLYDKANMYEMIKFQTGDIFIVEETQISSDLV